MVRVRPTGANADDPAARQVVRLSDIGWTDVTSTPAIFSTLLRRRGSQRAVTEPSVPVTYASLKNNDIDVLLGNWMQQPG